MFETRRQALGRKVKINDIGCRGCRRGWHDRCCCGIGPSHSLTKLFVQDCPENRCSMMYQVADNGVLQAETILVRCMSSPDPLAGPIDGRGQSIQLSLACQ
jgi:hypothetical protein